MTLDLPIWQRGNEKELIEDNNAQTFTPLFVRRSLTYWWWNRIPGGNTVICACATRDPGVDVSVLLLQLELGPGAGLITFRNFRRRANNWRSSMSFFWGRGNW